MKKTTEHTSAVTPRAAGTRQSWTSRAFALLGILGLAAAAHAENRWWTGTGTDTNYNTPANWGTAVLPSDSDTAQFTGLSAGKTVTFNGNYNIAYVWVGETAPEQGGTYSFISDEGVANPVVLTATDPSFGIASAGAISCADGENQRGALKILDGTHSAGACSYWGWGQNVKFNAEISGGTLNFNGANGNDCFWIMYGNGVENVIDINGGTLAVNGGDFLIGTGNDATSSTEINISNGGVLSVGTEQTERWMKFGVDGTGKITINVNEGGTLACWFITHTSTGDCELNLDGGTLKMLGATDFGNSIDPFNNDSFDVIVGENGGTLDTNGKNITISKLISGAGTLTITGGGSVLFTVQPECTIVADGATYTIQDENFYWTGNGDGVNWSDGSNWSKGAVPGADDDVVFNKAATVTIAETEVKSVAVNAAVTFNGGATLRLGSGGMSGSGTLTLAGANLRSATTTTASVDIVLADGSTNKFIVGADGANFTISGKVSSQEFGTGVLEITQGTGRNNANAGVKLTGDWSDFAGSIVYYQSWGSTSGVRTYQQRALDTFTKSATSANARWDVYATTYDIDLMRANGHFFAESGTAEAPAVYKFGSLKMRLPNNKNDTGYSSYVMLEVGNLDEDSSLLYSWRGAQNCGVRWIAPTATFGSYAANTAYIDIVGGGNVEFSASGVPTAINFKEKGGYVVLTSDATLNAAIIAAITTVDLDEDGVVGFYYDGETELIVDVSSKAALLSGKTIAKMGSGTLSITGVPGETACDVMVNDGSLVLPHGAVVGDVTVAQGASLVIDMIGAEDKDVVFAYASVTGDVIDRNTPSSGEIEKDDEAKTWTYVVTGSARTFKWNGEEGAAWTEASNWLIVDGESETTATDIPSTIDTVLIDRSATISASGMLAGDVQIATGVTLTIPAGLTFTKLTVDSGATIAFSSLSIGAVGDTLALITVGTGSGVTAALNLPSTYQVGVDADSGAFTATRTSGTYTWTNAKEDNNWATSGNWKVDDFVVTEVPAAEDTVVFPASDAEGFEAWAVTLPWDVYAKTVTLNANVVLSGARTLKANAIGGSAELQLNNAHIGTSSEDLSIGCNVRAVDGTTNYFYIKRNVSMSGGLVGSGTIIADHGRVNHIGVTFNGDNSGFYGKYQTTNWPNYDRTWLNGTAASSSNAVWQVACWPASGKQDQATRYLIKDDGPYYFGAIIGGTYTTTEMNSKFEIGNRSDVASSFELRTGSNAQRGYVTKVGSGHLDFFGNANTLSIKGGTVHLQNFGISTISFLEDGGYIQLGYTTTSQEIVDVPAETDSETEEVITPAQTHTEYTYTPYDPSALIKNSTAAIGFDDQGTNCTWATALDYSNKGGLTKAGTGTLTLAEVPQYEGVTWVQAGTLVVPGETELTLDPRSLGTVSGGTVTGYAYRPDTVLDGTETGDDSRDGNIDVSGIRKIDISDPSYVTALVNQRRVILCGTTGSIKGLKHAYFVQGDTLIVPDKPAEVDDSQWDWCVRIMQVDGKSCLCVAQRIVPFAIRIR